MKWLILSDLHLGSRASCAERHIDSLARLAPLYDRVVFNGDTLDRFYGESGSNADALQYLARVRERCTAREAPVEFITGNHDPAISQTHRLYHEESRTLIVHGDAIADCTHPSKPDEQELMRRFGERWESLGGRPIDLDLLHQHYRSVQCRYLPIINPYGRSKTAWQYAKALLFPPRRPVDILLYWKNAPRLALQMARGFPQPVENLAVGHSHRHGSWTLDGVRIMNTGSFMPFSTPYAVTIDGTQVQHLPLRVLFDRLRSVHGARSPAPETAGIGRGATRETTVRN